MQQEPVLDTFEKQERAISRDLAACFKSHSGYQAYLKNLELLGHAQNAQQSPMHTHTRYKPMQKS